MRPIDDSKSKQEEIEMPDEFFEKLTFGELEVGEKFIAFPSPGDSDGHGGLRTTSYIFIKTHENTSGASPDLQYKIPHGRAINIHHGSVSDYPNSLLVIRVK